MIGESPLEVACAKAALRVFDRVEHLCEGEEMYTERMIAYDC